MKVAGDGAYLGAEDMCEQGWTCRVPLPTFLHEVLLMSCRTCSSIPFEAHRPVPALAASFTQAHPLLCAQPGHSILTTIRGRLKTSEKGPGSGWLLGKAASLISSSDAESDSGGDLEAAKFSSEQSHQSDPRFP